MNLDKLDAFYINGDVAIAAAIIAIVGGASISSGL